MIVNLNLMLEPQVHLTENKDITRYSLYGCRIPDRKSPFSGDLKYIPQFSLHLNHYSAADIIWRLVLFLILL